MEEDKTVYIGSVIWFSAGKGYGFLSWKKSESSPQEKDLFVHYSDISMSGFKTLNRDQEVQFKLGINNRGEPKAIEVVPLIKSS